MGSPSASPDAGDGAPAGGCDVISGPGAAASSARRGDRASRGNGRGGVCGDGGGGKRRTAIGAASMQGTCACLRAKCAVHAIFTHAGAASRDPFSIVIIIRATVLTATVRQKKGQRNLVLNIYSYSSNIDSIGHMIQACTIHCTFFPIVPSRGDAPSSAPGATGPGRRPGWRPGHRRPGRPTRRP